MNTKNTLLIITSLVLGLSACAKPSPQGTLTLVVTANVRAQLDPCG